MAKALMYWTEENRWSVISLKAIEQPRKDLDKYGVEFVRASYPGFKGKTFPGLIVAISEDRDGLMERGVLLDTAVSKAPSLRAALSLMGVKADHLDKRADVPLSSFVPAVADCSEPQPGKCSTAAVVATQLRKRNTAADPEPEELPLVKKQAKPVKKKPAVVVLNMEKQKQLVRHQEMLRSMNVYTSTSTPSSPCPVDLEELDIDRVSGLLDTSPTRHAVGLKFPKSSAMQSASPESASPESPPPPPRKRFLNVQRALPPSYDLDGAPTPRATVAVKAPRSVLTTAPCTEACKANVDALRVQVKDLQAKVTSLEARQRELEGELVASYATQDIENHSPPSGRQKPGCHSPATAAAHHMVELDPGSGVFCYPSNLIEAKGKSGDAMPRYLISVFYTTNQLVEAGNLSGTNGKQGLDKRIVDAIVSYTLANNEGSSSARVRTVLRSKLSAAICKYQKSK